MNKFLIQLRKWSWLHRHQLISSTLLTVAFALLFFSYRAHTHSLYFADETEHFTLGWMMYEFGAKLYDDLSTNHQPLPILFSAAIVPLIRYGSFFELIGQLRESMFIFTYLATLVLTWRFTYRGLIASILTYSLGYLYFGWYILAESLAAPTVLYMVLFASELVTGNSQKVGKWGNIGFAFSAFWTVFNMLALAPFVGVLSMWVLWKLTPKLRLILIGSGLLFTLTLFLIINPLQWFEESVYNIWKYFLADEQHKLLEFTTFLFYPFLGFYKFGVDISRSLLLVGITIAVGIGILVARSQQKVRTALTLSGLFLVVSLLNNRVLNNPAVFYGGFHLFPYLAGLFGLFAHVTVTTLQKFPKTSSVLTLLLVLTVVIQQNTAWTREEKSRLSEYYIQYEWQESHARALSILSDPGDTLFTGPDGQGFLNVLSGLPLAGRQNFHLEWAYRSTKLRGEFQDLMRNSPPTFIYLTEDESGYHTELSQIIPQDYRVLLQHDKETQLYMRSEKTLGITQEQINKLAEIKYAVASQASTAAKFGYKRVE